MLDTQPNQRPSALAGKTTLVTGSTGGLGLAIAEALAQSGCRIVLHGLEPADAMQAECARLEAKHSVQFSYTRSDLSDAAAVVAMMSSILETHGRIDVLVNNAVTRHFSPIESFPVEAWDRALAVNLSANFHATRLALPGMRETGWGRIINMTSVYGSRAVANRIDYITTKTALIGMTRAVAVETLNQGITCNAICPGSVSTPSIEARVQAVMRERGVNVEQAIRHFLEGKQPTGRFVESSHVGDLVAFLCGPAGRDITGATLPVEGGWLAS